MKRFTLMSLAVITLLVTFGSAVQAADLPKDRVAVMYFHRTQRCPTCLKMGSYVEEAVENGFPNQAADGSVGFYLIDYQAAGNAGLAKAYKITGPTLIVAKVTDNKVTGYENLTDIWTKVREKADFLAYVRENIAAYLK